jgi:hypothetical protein
MCVCIDCALSRPESQSHVTRHACRLTFLFDLIFFSFLRPAPAPPAVSAQAQQNMFRVEPVRPGGPVPREHLGWFARRRRALQEWMDEGDGPAPLPVEEEAAAEPTTADAAPRTAVTAGVAPLAVVVPTKPEDFAATLSFFTEGAIARMTVLEIFPADAPREALLSGHGCRIRLTPPT